MDKRQRETKLLEKVLRVAGLALTESSKEHAERCWDPAGDLLSVKTLRCIRAEDREEKDAPSVHFIDKDSGSLSWRYFGGAWYFEDEAEIVEKLGEAREFMWLDERKLAPAYISIETFVTEALRWNNPFFGCKSLEELALKLDLLGGGAHREDNDD